MAGENLCMFLEATKSLVLVVPHATPCYNRDTKDMGAFFDQIFILLTVPPGNFVYHLVLVFSLAGAFQAAFTHRQTSGFPQVRRTLLGLGILLLAQFALFLFSGLGWQGIIFPPAFLPPMDRAFTLFSLIWITWLWAFPEPSRAGDAGAILLSLLTGAALTLSIINWTGQLENNFPYNTIPQEIIWQSFTLGYIAISALVLFIRRSNGWANGLSMLILAFLGHLLHLIFGRGSGDFPGIIRFAYLAAYPILLTLSQRFPAPTIAPEVPPTSIKQTAHGQERRRFSTDPKTFHALLAVAAETSANKVSHAITRALAQVMLADLCFLIYLTDDKKQLVIASGYDLIREENLEGASLNKQLIPMLAGAIQRGRPLRLPASSTSADLKGLGDMLGLTNPGHLMSVPIITSEKNSIGALLLLSPYSSRLWSAEDQGYLANIAPSLVPIIQRGRQVTSLEQQGQENQQALEASHSQVTELKRKNEELTRQLEKSRGQVEQGQTQVKNVAALLDAQEKSQQLIARLQQENKELQTTMREEGSGTSAESARMDKELHQAREEIAHLQNQLAKSSMKVTDSDRGQLPSRPNEQPQVIVSISQELRQPMSSIIGYTDLLLGESVGILGALQRKFVERIKISTERIGSLIDDLIQLTTLESGLAELKPEPIDLNEIIDNAMSYTSSLVREKNISIHLDLPKTMAPIYADREALQQILIHLLQNAGAATPVEGSITLRVQTQTEDDNEYVLIQVTDTGGGIPVEDLPRVFSRLYRADNVLIQGVGDTGVGLSIAKTLTEAQHGRIWVESDPGVGSTFSVLLPIAKEVKPAKKPKRK